MLKVADYYDLLNYSISVLSNTLSSEEDVTTAIINIKNIRNNGCGLVKYLGSGSTSDVYLINGLCYKVPHVVKSIVDGNEVNDLRLMADYEREAKSMIMLSNTEYSNRLVNYSQWCLVSKYVVGNTLGDMSLSELNEIEEQVFIDLIDAIMETLKTGLYVDDLSEQNLIYSTKLKRLILVDLGEVKNLSESYFDEVSSDPFRFAEYLTDCGHKHAESINAYCDVMKSEVDEFIFKNTIHVDE